MRRAESGKEEGTDGTEACGGTPLRGAKVGRSGVHPSCTITNWIFESSRPLEYALSERGTVATKIHEIDHVVGDTRYNHGVIADGPGCVPMYAGVHFWELEVVENERDTCYGVGSWSFGVCRPGIGYESQQDLRGRNDTWVASESRETGVELFCDTCEGFGMFWDPAPEMPDGSRIGLLLDLENGGTLTMYWGGKPCGTIAEGLVGPLLPCVDIAHAGKVVKICGGLVSPAEQHAADVAKMVKRLERWAGQVADETGLEVQYQNWVMDVYRCRLCDDKSSNSGLHIDLSRVGSKANAVVDHFFIFVDLAVKKGFIHVSWDWGLFLMVAAKFLPLRLSCLSGTYSTEKASKLRAIGAAIMPSSATVKMNKRTPEERFRKGMDPSDNASMFRQYGGGALWRTLQHDVAKSFRERASRQDIARFRFKTFATPDDINAATSALRDLRRSRKPESQCREMLRPAVFRRATAGTGLGFKYTAEDEDDLPFIFKLLTDANSWKQTKDGRKMCDDANAITELMSICPETLLRVDGKDMWTPIMDAAFINKPASLAVMLKHDVQPGEGYGCKAFYLQHKAVINAKESSNGYTALHLAVLSKFLDVKTIELLCGAKALHSRDNDGHTALDYASHIASLKSDGSGPISSCFDRHFDRTSFYADEVIPLLEEAQKESLECCAGGWCSNGLCNTMAGFLNGRVKYCSRCKLVAYKSPECQRMDWKYHKKVCQKKGDDLFQILDEFNVAWKGKARDPIRDIHFSQDADLCLYMKDELDFDSEFRRSESE